mgnify:CR=1 FL=1
MSTEMKLIMENWKGFINEEFDACEGTSFTIGDYAGSIELLTLVKDEEIHRDRIKELEANPRANFFKSLGNTLLKLGAEGAVGEIGGQIAKATTGSAAKGAGATAGGVAGAALGGPPGAAIGAVVGGVVGEKGAELIGSSMAGLFLSASRKENSLGGRSADFLSTFCVDNSTLDLIEDKYQAQYIKESDIIEELKGYLTNAPANKPLPDITQHLVDWLNKKSDYKQSDHTTMVAKN